MPRHREPLVVTLLLGAALLLFAMAGQRVGGLLAMSARVVAGTLLVALPMGGLLGMLIAKTNAPGRRTAAWLLAAMLFMPLYLQAAAWEAAFGQLGWWTLSGGGAAPRPVDPLLAGPWGVSWVHGLAAAPWVALIVGAALRAIDRAHEEQVLLDASAPRVMARVTLRYAATGAGAAALWVAAVVASEMAVTDLMMVRTFAEEIYTQAVVGVFDRASDAASATGAAPLAAGVAALGLVGAAAMLLALRWLVAADAGVDRPWRWRPRRGRPVAAALLWAPLLLLVAVPVVNLASQAGVTVERIEGGGWARGWSVAKLASVVVNAPWRHRQEFLTTLQLGVGVATGAVVIALLAAWWLRPPKGGGAARPRSRPLVACGVLAFCLVTPGPVLGVATIRLLNHPWDSPLAGLTWMYDHTLLAPWIVQVIRAAPVATLILWPALASVPESVLDAARSDGAGRWRRLLTIAVPLRWRAIATAGVAALAVSVGEVSATKLVLPPGSTTIAERVWTLLHYGVDGQVAGLSLVMIGVLLAGAAAMSRVAGVGDS